MSKFLIVYGTKEGQTGKIAERLGELIRQRGHEVDVANARRYPDNLSLDEYKGIIVGSSVHAGRYSPSAAKFIRRYKTRLENRPSAFYSVSLSDVGDNEAQREYLSTRIQKFFNQTGWHPSLIGRFAGSLAYTRYGFCTRILMQCMSKSMGHPTDTSHDYEYTDWDKVAKFAEEFLDQALVADTRS